MSLSMRSFSVLVLCCFSPLLFAADVPGSQDLPIVPRMADAQIVDYRPGVELERIYPLGSIRKISGQLRFDGQVSARGTATSVTYELPPGPTSTHPGTPGVPGGRMFRTGSRLRWRTATTRSGS